MSARSLYDPVEDELGVSVQSADESALSDAARVITGTIEKEFEESYEEQMSVKLRTRLFQLERDIETNLNTIDRIDRQIEQVSTISTVDTPNLEAVAKLQTLETQRAGIVGVLTEAQADEAYLKQAEQSLPQLAAEPISVRVVEETRVSRFRVLLPLLLLAVGGSFVLAAIVVFFRSSSKGNRRQGLGSL